MKKLIIILLALISVQAFTQEIIKIEHSSKIVNSQKYGITPDKEEYTITIEISENTFGFNTREDQQMTQYTTTKTTDNYVIGKDASGNYCFYGIKAEQVYVIDYFMNRYSVMSYGVGYSVMKQTNEKMMSMLKADKTQKDVIYHLITQSEMDF